MVKQSNHILEMLYNFISLCTASELGDQIDQGIIVKAQGKSSSGILDDIWLTLSYLHDYL